jgi:hypothetical protein
MDKAEEDFNLQVFGQKGKMIQEIKKLNWNLSW